MSETHRRAGRCQCVVLGVGADAARIKDSAKKKSPIRAVLNSRGPFCESTPKSANALASGCVINDLPHVGFSHVFENLDVSHSSWQHESQLSANSLLVQLHPVQDVIDI